MEKLGTAKKAVCAILAAAMMLSAAACSGGSSASPAAAGTAAASSGAAAGAASAAPKTTDKMVIARAQDSINLDPVMTSDNVDIWVMNLLMEGLVKSSDDGKTIEPCLAEKWDISSDHLTYTFHLRKGVKFSDGTPVTGEDWVYSLKRVRDTKEGAWGSMLENVTDVQAPDDTTVIIKVKQPTAALLSDLSLFACGVMPKKYVEQAGTKGLSTKPVGTGPYMLKEWDKGQKMIFVANPNYWQAGKPVTKEIDFNLVADDNTRIMQLESGQIDIATDIPFNRIKELESVSGVNMKKVSSTEADFIALNNKNDKLKNPLVRQALAYATNRQDIINAVFFGNATVANTFISPSAPHFKSDIPSADYNVDKAKQLLQQAGESSLSLTIKINSGSTQDLQLATMLKEQWKKAGVTLDIVQMDNSARSADKNAFKYDVTPALLTSDISDTSELVELICIASMTQSMHLGWNGDKQQAAEKLAKQAGAEMDESKRKDLYGQALTLVNQDMPMIPLYYVPFPVAMRSNVQGFVQTPLGNYRFENLSKS